MSRYGVNRCKGAVVYLLRAAHIIKLDYLHWLWVVEVTERRINKSQMTIFADAEHGKIGRGCPEQFTVAFTLNRTVLRFAAQSMKFLKSHSVDKTIYEKTSEGLWCAIIHTEILIEMEANNSGPINSGSFDECSQKLILRRCGCEDAHRFPA